MNNMTRNLLIILMACILLFVASMFYKVCFSTSPAREISDVSTNRLIVYIQADSLEQRLDTFDCDWMEISGIHFWSSEVTFEPTGVNDAKFTSVVNPDSIATLIAKNVDGIEWNAQNSTLTLPIESDYVTMPVYLLKALSDQGAINP